jgi:two-component system, chemotaxis family, protein-glutamate methylesterase/glutaminase
MGTVVAAVNPTPLAGKILRVIIVDDAVVVRSLMAHWIGAESDMQIVASLRTGREALTFIERSAADVVVLDINMPDLDGISTLRLLLEKKRDLVVIMVSTLTRRSAEISLRALSLGAADYLPKPDSAREVSTSVSFRRELIEKIRILGHKRQSRRRYAPVGARRNALTPPPEFFSGPRSDRSSVAETSAASVRLRPFATVAPRALLVGASTGGPQALMAIVEKLAAAIDYAPLLIAQHMPPTFTAVLAEHLSRASGRSAHEAEDGEPVLAGEIYVAPGGRHMRVVNDSDCIRIALGDDPPINFCKPAVDALFTSAAAVWGAGSLALVLTGMGADGALGAENIVAAGGSVIAQDEETSVVWGMPRSVAEGGLCSAVLPVDLIAPKLVHLFSGVRS